jgi:hypothetical protein
MPTPEKIFVSFSCLPHPAVSFMVNHPSPQYLSVFLSIRRETSSEPGDESGLRRLEVNLTSDPNFSSKDLFIA